ncbi:TPA: hypothetical protein RMT52_004558 [Escherichia coli]|nr:hypothetical protein [Escherichia coli]HAX1981806.1 hypothetical protein [Escherichia coli]HAX2344592.1 hypothetical protein [Escherichia coli]HBN7237801.1 hypothetical protein [Escherichia coli]HBN7444954.1 hypothetical protein [Escherichia coli]
MEERNIHNQKDDFKPDLLIFASGCFLRSSRFAGVGIVFYREDSVFRKSVRFSSRHLTSHYMRIKAVVTALDLLKGRCRVVVYSDNQSDIIARMKKEQTFWRSRKGRRAIADSEVSGLQSRLCERFNELCSIHEVKFVLITKKNSKGQFKRQISVSRGLAISEAQGLDTRNGNDEL